MLVSDHKLIYVSFARLTNTFSRDYFIDYCIKKGAKVEFWDIVSLMRESYNEYDSIYPDYLRIIKSFADFEKLIQSSENKKAIYIMEIPYLDKYSRPYILLSRYNCTMICIKWGNMPIYREFSTNIKKITNALFNIPIVFNALLVILFKRINLYKPLTIVFYSGKVIEKNDHFTKKLVQLNCIDFDKYKDTIISSKRVMREKYAVFLDCNLPYQSDLKVHNLKALNSSAYFKSHNNFFDLMESAYGVKIVIALHPKSNYNNDEFKRRKSYRNLTAELVKDAEYVIGYSSTSIGYAILNFKPIIFIYNDEMMAIYKKNFFKDIKSVASYLDSNIYNINKIIDGKQVKICPPNYQRYKSYKYDYLTSPETEHLSSAEIFLNEILHEKNILN